MMGQKVISKVRGGITLIDADANVDAIDNTNVNAANEILPVGSGGAEC